MHYWHFNPHSHKGSDTTYKGWQVIPTISIHTPTRGVTQTQRALQQRHIYFNPHSHKGSDYISFALLLKFFYFNPHSHKGSDITTFPTCHSHIFISIHTPTRGVTISVMMSPSVFFDFNPHSHKGSDHQLLYSILLFEVFQSTLPQGE